jgi:hypothetical protein
MLSLSYEREFADRYKINVVQCRGAWLFYVILITAHIAADRIWAFSFWDRPEKQEEFRFGNVERLSQLSRSFMKWLFGVVVPFEVRATITITYVIIASILICDDGHDLELEICN